MSKGSKLIIVIGPTGSGKSSFINDILSEEKAPVDASLHPDAVPEVVGYGPYYTSDGTVLVSVQLVDTPGFDVPSGLQDAEILDMVAEYISKGGHSVAGVIFLHSIIGDAFKRMTRRNMTTIKKICGSDSMENVVVVTTFWESAGSIEEGKAYEAEALEDDEGMLKVLHSTKDIRFYRWGLFEQGEEQTNGEGFLPPRSIVDYLLALELVQSRTESTEDTRVEPAVASGTSADTGPVEDIQEPKTEIRHQLDVEGYYPTPISPSKEERHHYNSKEVTENGRPSSIVEEGSEYERESGNGEVVTRDDLAELRRDIGNLSNANEHAIATLIERNNELVTALQKAEKGRSDLAGISRDIAKLSNANDVNIATLFEHNDKLVTTLQKVEKGQGSLSIECRALCAAVQKSADGVSDLYASLATQVSLAEQNDTLRSALAKADEERSRALREVRRERDALASECSTFRADVQKLRGELSVSRTSLESQTRQSAKDRAEFNKDLSKVVAENEGLRWAIASLSKEAPPFSLAWSPPLVAISITVCILCYILAQR